MTIKVTQTTNSYSVKVQGLKKFKINVAGGNGSVAAKLTELEDFDPSGVMDSYVIMYDATTQKYKTVNPDLVLSKAVTEPVSAGLPADFINKLDVDLDDKIDIDAGTF